MKFTGLDIMLAAIAVAYVFLIPFTKVEESFNLQATHDVLWHKLNLNNYDHLEFPGVVPRTFWGPVFLSALSYPSVLLLQLLKAPKIYWLYAVRATLAMASVASLANFRAALKDKFGKEVAVAFAVSYAVQFHPLFYAGRPLPNIFACILSTWGCASWVRGQSSWRPLAIITFGLVIFRCDLVLLLGPLTLTLLIGRKVSILQVVAVGILAGGVALMSTVALDSLMWRRTLWPEGEVFWFNTVENKSSEWGVMPFHWYFTSALPRSLLAPLLLAPVGAVLDRRVRVLFGVAMMFIGLYSNLPHKELRFIFPVFPLLNTCAAVALARVFNNRNKSLLWRVALVGCFGALLASVAASSVFFAASRCNYPGGEALHELHELHDALPKAPASPSVHIGVFPAMTGVSRFGELESPWSYSKEENIPLDQLASHGFTYLISAESNIPGFQQVKAVEGFHRLKIVKTVPFIEVVKAPQVYIHADTGVNMEKEGI